jgi:hypothetical protein
MATSGTYVSPVAYVKQQQGCYDTTRHDKQKKSCFATHSAEELQTAAQDTDFSRKKYLSSLQSSSKDEVPAVH